MYKIEFICKCDSHFKNSKKLELRIPNENQATTRLSSLGKRQTKVLEISRNIFFHLECPHNDRNVYSTHTP